MARKTHILVVDDEKVVRESLCEWFTEDGYVVDTAADGAEALRKVDEDTWDILLVDIKMPGMDGLELQRRVKRADPNAIVIIITAYATVDTAVQALKQGAYDYITKPIDPDDLARVIGKAAERQQLVRENEELKQTLESVAGAEMAEIIGESRPMKKVREMISTVAETDATVLIAGESGTGKELVARAIHRASRRRHMPLVTVNCAGLPEGLVESELFGHEKGAFTGASYRRKGKFELADGGTVFFDEIGDISPKTQIDLLRVLEEKTVTRIGGDRPTPVDFRVIAASHRDLVKAVEEETFRLDLFYRLNVFTIELPALRERPEDIPLLAHFFLERMAMAMGRVACRFAPEAINRLREYDWPGNVRELENAIERAVVLEHGEVIQAASLPLQGPGAASRAEDPIPLSEVEKRHIQSVLDQMDGNISKAARFLEVDRVTLYNKIRKYGLRRPRD
ncbi:MAG: sigma-54 dependent transcriptional regulator [Gemmatimonadota bacterium]